MDYGAFPPEFNSARMYAGPGPGSMLAAAGAWNGLAAELRSVASSYGSVISQLTTEWLGPSSTAMAAAAVPYVAWLSATAGQAELTAAEAQAAAGAYQAAFTMTVPPPLIAANRAQLMTLTATNLFGQNTPAIAATEAQYGEMWAQDAAAMYSYAAQSAAVTAQLTPIAPPPETTNPAGLAAQGAPGAGTSTGAGVQSALSQLMSTVPTTLQNSASPNLSTSSTSGLSGLLNGLLGGSSSAAPTTAAAGPLGGLVGTSGIASSAVSQYLAMPGWAGISLLSTVFSPVQQLMTTPISNALTPAAAAADVAGAAEGASDAAAGAAAAAADAAVGGAGGLADLGGLAGLGQAASVGALSVPANWGWAATAPTSMLGGLPMMPPLVAADSSSGAGLGFPLMFPGGLSRVAAAGAAGVVAGAAGTKYLPRLNVVARSPAAGYSADSEASPIPKYPVPAGFPTNGNAPPGYQPAVVYLPVNGHAPANV